MDGGRDDVQFVSSLNLMRIIFLLRQASFQVVAVAALVCVCSTMSHAATRGAHHRHRTPRVASPAYSWENGGVDLSPVTVQAYLIPTTPTTATFVRKMHVENGALSRGTHYMTRPDLRSRDLFILQITQSLEGGFDSVNMYDRGILSWGLMQWTAWTGSLPRALGYMKARLASTHRARIWQKVFVDNGLDVEGNQLVAYGKPLANEADMRLAFRGTVKPGMYDPKLVTHWVTTMARAGRQSDIAQLEIEYASHVVDGVLTQRLDLPYHSPGRAGVTAADLASSDPYAEALIFALWTNNPRHAVAYVEAAARAARRLSTVDDPALWRPGAFSDALFCACLTSRFGNWQARASMIAAKASTVRTASAGSLCPFERDYQTLLAARKVKRLEELASRRQMEKRVRLLAAGKLTPSPSSERRGSRVAGRSQMKPDLSSVPGRVETAQSRPEGSALPAESGISASTAAAPPKMPALSPRSAGTILQDRESDRTAQP